MLLRGLGWPPHACSDLLQENPAGQPGRAGELLEAQCGGQEAPSQGLSWLAEARAWSFLPRMGCPQLWKLCSIPSSPLSGCLGWVVRTAWCLPLQPPFHRSQVSSRPEGFLPFIGILHPHPHNPHQINSFLSFAGGSGGKESACNMGDLCWVPGSGRSHGRGNGSAPQYSCVGNPMDRGACWATVHGVAKSQV